MDFMETGNRVILGFTNIYNISEENTLLRQVYNACWGNYRRNTGNDYYYMESAFRDAANRRGFSFCQKYTLPEQIS